MWNNIIWISHAGCMLPKLTNQTGIYLIFIVKYYTTRTTLCVFLILDSCKTVIVIPKALIQTFFFLRCVAKLTCLFALFSMIFFSFYSFYSFSSFFSVTRPLHLRPIHLYFHLYLSVHYQMLRQFCPLLHDVEPVVTCPL